MPAMYLTTPGTRVHIVSQRLRVEVPPGEDPKDSPGEIREIPFMDIEEIVFTEHVAFTIPALAECMRRDIPVVLTTHGDRILGLCLPPAPDSAARLAQYRKSGDPAFRLALAASCVEAKIVNSRRVLQRLAGNRVETHVGECLARLADLAVRCKAAGTLDVLRGCEGMAAGLYFSSYSRFFPESCPFEHRSRRPPLNPPNAVLSYAYTLMTAEMECALHAAGLDPVVGFLHEPEDRRPSLALDLIEAFRAPVADAMALDLVSHGTLNPRDHFESRDGGVYMNVQGKKRFFGAYERRVTREFVSEHTGMRTTLRNEFRNQAIGVKQSIVEGRRFSPFLMN